MTCISPPEPEERLLMAFLDGEADPETVLHLKGCQHCRDRADALAREQELYASRFLRITCPSTTELGEYHLHLLSPDRSLVVSQHLHDCPYCTQEVAQLGEFLSDLEPVPERGMRGMAQALIARLVGGGKASGPAGEPAYALRGGVKSPLTFEANGMMIILDFEPTNQGRMGILGQVAAEDQDDWTGATVKLQYNDELTTTVFLDDLGAFRFEEAPSGFAQITITSQHGVEVRIPSIDLYI